VQHSDKHKEGAMRKFWMSQLWRHSLQTSLFVKGAALWHDYRFSFYPPREKA